MTRRGKLAVLVLALGVVFSGHAAVTDGEAPGTRARRVASADVQPSFPIRAAFYYAWFPEAWQQKGVSTYTKFTPILGRYDSSNPAVIRRHVADMRYGGLDAGISSWWGPGTRTDQRVEALLAAAADTRFRWALYYEKESLRDPSAASIKADLTYIKHKYASAPEYLRVGERFVVFVYAQDTDDCDMARRWNAANTVGAYVVLKVFEGYRTCDQQPQDWHQYAAANYTDSQLPYAFTVSPGFYKADESRPRLARSLVTWQRSLGAMTSSKARWQLVTSYNEWGEGTAVEPAQEWRSASGHGAFLDALRRELGAASSEVTEAPATARRATPRGEHPWQSRTRPPGLEPAH